MKSVAILLGFLALSGAWASAAEAAPKTYYVQLVRGTDADQKPPEATKAIEGQLAGHFHKVFRWKHYWELGSQQVVVNPGEMRRVRFANGREVQIDLSEPKLRTVAAFENGKLVSRTHAPRGETMTLMGGDREAGTSWFIVVRRDKPGS